MVTDNRNAPWRQSLIDFLTRPATERALIILIIINAVILGLETYPAIMARMGSVLMALDNLILGVFVIEIVLRMVGHGARFFRDPWRIFDFIVVGIALLPSTGPFSVLRALRILRVLRILTLVPSMKRVIGGLLGAIPGLSSVIAVMALIFYVGAVIATKLFGADFPDWFGTLGASAYTLFQVMTLESWSMGIARPVIAVFPGAWVFFVLFILIATFTMLNLFIAVIVNAIQAEHDEEVLEAEQTAAQHVDDQHELTRREVASLRDEIQALRAMLQAGRTDPSHGAADSR